MEGVRKSLQHLTHKGMIEVEGRDRADAVRNGHLEPIPIAGRYQRDQVLCGPGVVVFHCKSPAFGSKPAMGFVIMSTLPGVV
jgi:hypothetical protein